MYRSILHVATIRESWQPAVRGAPRRRRERGGPWSLGLRGPESQAPYLAKGGRREDPQSPSTRVHKYPGVVRRTAEADEKGWSDEVRGDEGRRGGCTCNLRRWPVLSLHDPEKGGENVEGKEG